MHKENIETRISKLSSEKIVSIQEWILKHQYFLISQIGFNWSLLLDTITNELAERCEKAFKEFYETNEYAKENWYNGNPPSTIDYSRLDYEVAPRGWCGPIWHICW